MNLLRILWAAVIVYACATPQPEPTPGPAVTYEVVNQSSCTARIVLYDTEGNVVENMKWEDLRPGRTERYLVPGPGMKLDAVAVDAMGNACSLTEIQKIRIRKVQ